jgi:Protein of unknown function (DUF2971)
MHRSASNWHHSLQTDVISMLSHLYRFRSIYAVIDRLELSSQEIYFAPSEKLNDPMEGYKDVFWSGDVIVWRNLLRHYLLCLLRSAFAMGTDSNGAHLKTLVFSAPEDLPSITAQQTYERMCEAFRADANIQKFLETLSTRSTPVRRDELRNYLRCLHPFALSVMMTEFEQRGIKGIFRDLDALRAQAATMNEAAARVACLKPAEPDKAEAMFLAGELIMSQMQLIQDFNTATSSEARSTLFLTRDFPESYVRALDELTHPPFSAACFVADPTNSSMWATYGDSHKGVCLKFKSGSDTLGRPSLNLYGITGWRSSAGMEMEPVYSFAPHAFYKINYSQVYPEIDFFNSLGRLPIPIMNAVWYRGEDGQLSSCRGARSCDTDTWRENYWEAFETGATCKTSEWAHEQEYRLLLRSEELRDDASRKLRYNFADLSGIIFGARTAVGDKLKIMRIVEEKCRAEGRRDFGFHQMQYSRQERCFKHMPLSLIRFR